MAYHDLLVDIASPIATVTLHRPDALNSLSQRLVAELSDALDELDVTDDVRAVVITGGPKLFASGSDIREMSTRSAIDQVAGERVDRWAAVRRFTKPLIAAVNGYVLGGGCELAMMCDLIIAGDGAYFGQPEVNLGIIAGAGGTQRWPRTVGKYVAMEINLSGEFMKASRAYQLGFVNKVVPSEATISVAQDVARRIGAKAPLAVRLAKESVERAFELGLSDGLAIERKNFHLLFGTEDQHEGMAAFLEKRPAEFTGR
jgi:enoyl-CoA hydratase/carnithine racemase